jgi:hypothetical protein
MNQCSLSPKGSHVFKEHHSLKLFYTITKVGELPPSHFAPPIAKLSKSTINNTKETTTFVASV